MNLEGGHQVRIELEDVRRWPDRDAVCFYAAEVFDNAGIRYPVRIMTEGIAVACFEAEVRLEGSYADIVQTLYRQELATLLKQSRLTPTNPQATVNVVFLVNGHDERQTRAGDIVIYDTVEKLKAVARQLGRI
jgi:hypothetical protein